MKIKPIYIKSLELQNIRTFGEPVQLNMEKADGTLPQWTLILGDNGFGKSTLLQSIAWMKPYLPYKKEEVPEHFLAAPMINDEENETLEGLVHNYNGDQQAIMRAVFVADQKLDKKLDKDELQYCKTSLTISLNSQSKLSNVDPGFELNSDVFYDDGVLIYAYGGSRKLGRLNLNSVDLNETIPNFVHEDTELYDAEEILHSLNYAFLSAKKADRKKYSRYIDKILKMLFDILPDYEDIKNIKIVPPNILDKNLKSGLLITTKHGEKIPYKDYSLGYKTVIAWLVDLAWRLIDKFKNTLTNPLTAPAIVLIDEVDLHLHPKWQREILQNVSKNFPNIQFIATAHSPLMVQDQKVNYAILQYDVEAKNVIILNEPENIDGWRVDQILTSDFFGLESSRGNDYDKLFEKRKRLIEKDRKTDLDEKNIRLITTKLSKLPAGETPQEIEDEQVITEIIDDLKKSKRTIII